ncbi:hypothetical protein TIFTF001_030657 [Ficus carica]|uniref:Uncharacterized protein n=1 Tax=Ficus carica TaxID=3494 RepID=A0AA88DTU3_FICCA|nr:hypothetical protein TIFTF001_030657 [Ficus carica]
MSPLPNQAPVRAAHCLNCNLSYGRRHRELLCVAQIVSSDLQPNKMQIIRAPSAASRRASIATLAPTTHQLSSSSPISVDQQIQWREGAGESVNAPEKIARERRSSTGVEGARGGRVDDASDGDG